MARPPIAGHKKKQVSDPCEYLRKSRHSPFSTSGKAFGISSPAGAKIIAASNFSKELSLLPPTSKPQDLLQNDWGAISPSWVNNINKSSTR